MLLRKIFKYLIILNFDMAKHRNKDAMSGSVLCVVPSTNPGIATTININ